MEKYAEIFEFMDVPGLNESSDIKEPLSNNNQENITSAASKFTNGFYFRQIFPLIKNNIKFSLFIFSSDNYDKENSKEILKAYIDKKYDENKKNQNLYNNSTKKEELKFKEINNLLLNEKQEQRDYCSLASFKESIFVLNKIDLVFPEQRDLVNKEFKEFIQKEFTNEKYIKLDDENEIPVMGKKLNDQISKYDSFEEYVKYYNFNSQEYEDHSKIFYKFIFEIMNKEFQLNINITKEEDIENEDEEEEEDEEDSDNGKEIIKPSFMKKIDFENYKEIKILVDKNREFNSFLNPKEYCKLKKLFIQNKKNLRKEKEDGSLEKIISDKMKKVINDYFAIDIYSSMQTKIISDFKIDPIKNNKKKIQKKLEDMMKNSKGIANPAQAIKDFKKYIDKIYYFDSSNQTICGTISDYESIKQYLEKTSAIRFLLVGPHNSGKSSLLNNFIGYNQNFLPTKTQECTKIGVIIKYIKRG